MGSSPNRAPGWYGRAWVRLLPAPLGSSVGHEFDSHPCPQHVESGFQHVMRLNLGQVQRVRLCPLKTVTGHHNQTVLGHLGVVRAAGVDNRWEGPWHVGTARETSRHKLGSINIQYKPQG